MTTIKEINTGKLQQIAEILKAVAHPVRIQVIDLLGVADRLTVTEIYEKLNVEQSLASHHLTKMKDKGILVCEREGKNMFYSLKDKKLTSIIQCIENCDI